MQKEDLKQIADLLKAERVYLKKELQAGTKSLQQELYASSKTLKAEMQESNKSILSAIDGKIDHAITEMAAVVNQAFVELEAKTRERFDAIDKQLDLKPSIAQFQHWADENMAPASLDIDRLKYINRAAYKELPSQLEISEVLIQEGIN
jgi:hypothetical protein